jgi:hypothetical protein
MYLQVGEIHYTRPKRADESSVLQSKCNDLKKKHLNGVEVHIFSISKFIPP